MPVLCNTKCGRNAILKRPKTGDALCKECFFWAFEEEIHHTIITASLFAPKDYVAIAASGGKDSTVLAHIMKLLNDRYNYGLKLVLLSIDEGITGYRDDSLETVKRNEKQYDIPLKILSYEELYGWTMDKIVEKVGRKNNCTFCGVFRRQALDRGAAMLKVDKIVTGHNADDIAETVVMNILRGDIARLQRCTAIQTSSEGTIPRSKPFKYAYEKEIVMYAHFKKLDYFSTECIYSPNAYRGHARAFLKDLERIRPSAIIDVIHSGECLAVREGVRLPTQTFCSKCGHVSSQAVCKACILLEGLNKGKPRLGIGKSSKVKEALEQLGNEERVVISQKLDIEQKDNALLTSENRENIIGITGEISAKNAISQGLAQKENSELISNGIQKETTSKEKGNISSEVSVTDENEEKCENCCKKVGGFCSNKISQIEDIGSSFAPVRPSSDKKGKVHISESIRSKLNIKIKQGENDNLSF